MAEWDVPNAITLHYAAQDEAPEASPEPAAEAAAPADYTGPRTLGGAPAPDPAQASSSSSSSAQRARGGLRTLRDLQNQGGPAQGHGHAHDDDDESGEDQDFFAGGEKSGLAVQNPNSGPSARDQINNIIDRARRYARPEEMDGIWLTVLEMFLVPAVMMKTPRRVPRSSTEKVVPWVATTRPLLPFPTPMPTLPAVPNTSAASCTSGAMVSPLTTAACSVTMIPPTEVSWT